MVLMDGRPNSGVLSHGVPNFEFLSGSYKLPGEGLGNTTLHKDPCAIGADLWWRWWCVREVVCAWEVIFYLTFSPTCSLLSSHLSLGKEVGHECSLDSIAHVSVFKDN